MAATTVNKNTRKTPRRICSPVAVVVVAMEAGSGLLRKIPRLLLLLLHQTQFPILIRAQTRLQPPAPSGSSLIGTVAKETRVERGEGGGGKKNLSAKLKQKKGGKSRRITPASLR